MSRSKNSLKNTVMFNPRASNEWSKDDSKFGQRMLEKMGWKQGQGIGLNNQGITENVKVRLKLDSKGLGYQIKEDQWLEVRSEFSELLSQLNQGVEGEDDAFNKGKKSLEAVSQSSKTRVHYHKFTHGKDIARYKKEDLIGILGKKENKEETMVPENKEFIQSGNMNEYFKSKKNKFRQNDIDSSSENKSVVDDQTDDLNVNLVQEKHTSSLENSNSNSNSRKRKKSSKKINNDDESKKSGENEAVEENSIIQNNENSKDEESCNIGSTPQKKMRNSESLCGSSVKFTQREHEVDVVYVCEKGIIDSEDCNSFQKRKKSSKKFQDENEILKADKNEVVEQQTEKTNNVSNRPRRKKKSDQCETSIRCIESNNSLESIRDRVCDENKSSIVDLTTEVDEKVLISDDEVEENNYVDVQPKSFNGKKKKKSEKKTNDVLLKADSEVIEIMNEDHDTNEMYRKKKKKSRHVDSNSCEASTPVVVLDDSPRELEKTKRSSEKLADTCLNKKSTKDFIQSVIDSNSSICVEDYISNFEKNKEDLMKKYREKYKTKYSFSSSDQIQIIGDEFDGRKLDCKRTDPIDVSVLKTTDRKNLSKAEKIVAKARLLKGIKDSTVTHNFEGSNLTNISGYGSEIC